MDAEFARAVLAGDLADGGLHADVPQRLGQQLAKEAEPAFGAGDRIASGSTWSMTRVPSW